MQLNQYQTPWYLQQQKKSNIYKSTQDCMQFVQLKQSANPQNTNYQLIWSFIMVDDWWQQTKATKNKSNTEKE